MGREVGNGSVASAAEALALMEATGADGVMVGRGALMNPWVFRQMRDELSGRAAFIPKPSDYRDVLQRFVALLEEYFPERAVVYRVKALIGWYTKGLPGGAELRTNVYAAKTLEEVKAAFNGYFAAEAIASVAS